MLSEDPLLIGTQVSLRGPAFDLVAERVLTLVGTRQIELVEEEQARCQTDANHQHGHHDAVDADAGRLDGGDFIGALH